MTSVEHQPEPFDLGGFPSLDDLTESQKQSIARKAGQRGLDTTPFVAGDGLFGDWDSGRVVDRGDPNARGIDAMLDSDGTARQLEQVLTLPIRSADHALIGGSERGRKLVDEQFPEPQRALFIGQQTSAIPFRKAFFELDWRLDGRDVRLGGPPAFRPAVACESLFERDTGRPDGFRKRVHDPGGTFNALDWSRWYGDPMPGWIPVTRQRSHVYVHGTHRQPLKGVSDLSVCWWAWETRKKLLFLWLQYCERAVAPKVAVYGKSPTEAAQNALEMSKLRSGGYAPLVRPDDPAAKAFEVLEASTAAAGLFETASRYLESHMVDSCLAGFTKLSSGASAGGRGSQALGEADQDYFQKARQAVANEQSLQATTDVLAPICILNGLDKADVPQLRISLNADHMSESLDLAKTLLTATTVNAPDEFLDGLLQVVAPTLGLDADKLRDAIAAYRDEQAQQREQAAAQFDDPEGLSERPGAPDPQAADLANEVDAAWAVVDASVRTGDPDGALDSLMGRATVERTMIDLAGGSADVKPHPYRRDPQSGAGNCTCGRHEGHQLHAAEKDSEEHTGGMVCLLPSAESRRRLAVKGGEDPGELHLTLAFLGDDVTGMPDDVRDELPAAVRTAISETNPGAIQARAFAHTTFNADGGPDGDRDPCAVYGIGDSDALTPLQRAVIAALGDVDGLDLPRQHTPWVPHVTAAYGKTGADLSYLGTVVFDRAAVATGGDWTILPLAGDEQAETVRGPD